MEKEKTCKNCGQEVDNNAEVCASCGAKAEKKSSSNGAAGFFVGIAIVIIAVIIMNPAKNLFGKDSSKISKAEFDSLETGMTYDEAVEIIGGEGDLSSRTEFGEYDTRMYTWKGEGAVGANAIVTFQNDSLMSKSQAGLK